MKNEDGWYRELCRLMAMAKDANEVSDLLDSLLTIIEREEIARRWQIVKLLMDGNVQWDVKDMLSVSIATVTRGAKEVKHGNGVLQKFFERLYSKKPVLQVHS